VRPDDFRDRIVHNGRKSAPRVLGFVSFGCGIPRNTQRPPDDFRDREAFDNRPGAIAIKVAGGHTEGHDNGPVRVQRRASRFIPHVNGPP
jgi:hypothetical protein